MSNLLRIATRESALALWQTQHVIDGVKRHYPDLPIQVVPMSTQGDQFLDQALQKIGGKGLFLKELEEALLSNKADIAVHSLKDVTAEITPGLTLAAFLPREDARDAVVSAKGYTLHTLPAGARVGTSSLRRQSQITAVRPDINTVLLRGNVPTRINKLLKDEYDAIILAIAGLKRLKLTQHVTEILPFNVCLPAVGQGVIVVQTRTSDVQTQQLLRHLDDPITRAVVLAERAMNARLGGSCYAPIGGLAQAEDNTLYLQGFVGSPDGTRALRDALEGSIHDPQALGEALAEKLLQAGANEIIQACALGRNA